MLLEKEIEKDWKILSFGEIIEFLTDFQANGSFADLKENVQYYSERNFAVLVRLKDLRHDLNNAAGFVYTDEKGYDFLKKSRVQEGDILVANVGAGVGTTLKMPKFDEKATLGPNMFRVDLKPEVLPKYFLAFTKSMEYWHQLNLVSAGSGQPKINKSQYRSIRIPVAPLSVQQQTVSKIEELFSEVDKGIEEIKTAQQQLKVYRQAVLKWAFEGKLTNNDVKEGELPIGWRWMRISEVARIETGTTPSKSNPAFYGKDFPFYKPTDLEAGENVFKSTDGLTKFGVEAARYVPENSTLVTCIGATIGKTGFIKKGGAFNQQINAIVPNELIAPKFVYYQTIGLHFQKQILENASATTLPIINKGKFQTLKMAICPVEEQQQIVQEIESRLSVCDKIEEIITNSLKQAEALRQSILKKAFEGKLV